MEHEKYIEKTDSARSKGLYDVQFISPEGGVAQVEHNVFFLCPFGSHLYGTEDENSDLDMKGIYISSIDDIILGEDDETRRFSTGSDDNKTGEGDLDVEMIELRKFISDAMQGQTYAVELLHCPESLRLVETASWLSILEAKDKLLSSQVKPFVGYCEAQARKYSMKGRRLSELEEVRDSLAPVASSDSKIDLEEVITSKDGLAHNIDEFEHVEFVEQEIRGQEESATLLKVGGKKYNLHDNVDKVFDSVKGEIDKYGERSHRAKDGIDWKAVYHAYRVAFELWELLEKGRIDFPLEQADFLKEVKHGEIPYERADEELPELIDKVTSMEGEIDSEPNEKYWNSWLVAQYREVFN
jgi:hypothetical protein